MVRTFCIIVLDEKKHLLLILVKLALRKMVKGINYSMRKSRTTKFIIHTSPDLRDGTCNQLTYSFGWLLSLMSQNVFKVPCLNSLSKECMSYNSAIRPTTNDVFTFIKNLLV